MSSFFHKVVGFLNMVEGKPNDISTKGFIDDFREHLVDGAKSTSGVHVTPDSSMRAVTVYACVRVISESLAQLPFAVMERKDKRRERDESHSLYRLFAIRPNSWMTPFEFIENLIAHVLLRGNHFSLKIKSSDGRVIELLPLHPGLVQVEQKTNYDLLYHVTDGHKVVKTYTQDEIFHVRGLSLNGYSGISPITLHREAVGLALATERHGSTLFGNGARPGGILTVSGKMSADAQKRLKDSWGEAMTGHGAHKTAVLEEGMTWQQVGMTSEDSQFLETRKFQRGEIAAIFRVPPHKIGDLERATFSNIEHQSLEFVQDTILPWVRRIEQAIHRDLMPTRHRNSHYVKFNIDSILRGDIKTRFEAYAKAIQWGFMNPDEIRELEDRNPRDRGDEFLVPLNMVPASMLDDILLNNSAAGSPAPEEDGKEEDKSNILNMVRRLSNERG